MIKNEVTVLFVLCVSLERAGIVPVIFLSIFYSINAPYASVFYVAL